MYRELEMNAQHSGFICANVLVKINQQNEAIRPLKTKLNSYINNEKTFDNPFSHKLGMNTTKHNTFTSTIQRLL